MCLDDCGQPITRRQLLVGGVATAAVAACGGAPTPAGPRAPLPVESSSVRFPNGDRERTGMLFRPASKERLPVVLVAHGNPGYASYLGPQCERIAARGFAVMFVDHFASFPPMPDDEQDRAAWRKSAGSASTWRNAATDFDAALRWMDSQRIADLAAVAGVGFCGGAAAFAHYAASGAKLRSLVLFYGPPRLSKMFQNPDDPLPDLVDLAARLRVPIQAHYGAHDHAATIDEARDFERRLVAAGAHPAFFYYADAGHGFMQAGEPLVEDHSWGHVPEAAALAETRMFEELDARLQR